MKNNTRQLCFCGICVALCYVLPVAFHATALGSVLSPMHIPVLLCGLVCGGWYGALCGLLGPVLSSILSGMPPVAFLSYMVPELMVYGLVSGLCVSWIRTGKTVADLYISLGIAMVLGRVVGGIAKAIFYMGTGEAFSLAVWASSYFVTSLPGIICHLILVPLLVMALHKAKLIPACYSNR